MIALPIEFKDGTGGYSAAPLTYKQVAREGNVAVYQRFHPDGKPKDFETIVIKVIPKGTQQKFPNGVVKTIEDDTEKYPSTGQWGHIAWSYGNLAAAKSKMEDVFLSDVFGEKAPEMDITVDGIKYFTVGQLATSRGVSYINAATMLKDLMEKGSVKFVGEKRMNVKGNPSKIYELIS